MAIERVRACQTGSVDPVWLMACISACQGQIILSPHQNTAVPQMFLGNQELSDGSARPGSANR